MDAAQEARAAEINDALRKRGAGEVTGGERRKLVDELAGLLTPAAAGAATLDPAKKSRLDEINGRLMDNALGKPGSYIPAIERAELTREAADILSSASDGGGTGGDAAG